MAHGEEREKKFILGGDVGEQLSHVEHHAGHGRMREHHALGEARRAGRIADGKNIVGLRFGVVRVDARAEGGLLVEAHVVKRVPGEDFEAGFHVVWTQLEIDDHLLELRAVF